MAVQTRPNLGYANGLRLVQLLVPTAGRFLAPGTLLIRLHVKLSSASIRKGQKLGLMRAFWAQSTMALPGEECRSAATQVGATKTDGGGSPYASSPRQCGPGGRRCSQTGCAQGRLGLPSSALPLAPVCQMVCGAREGQSQPLRARSM